MMADNEVLKLSETILSSCTSADCIEVEHLKIFKTVKSGLGTKGLSLPKNYIDKDGNELALLKVMIKTRRI